MYIYTTRLMCTGAHVPAPRPPPSATTSSYRPSTCCVDGCVATKIEVVQPNYDKDRDKDRRLRPDLVLHGADQTLFVDVSVCHPLAPSVLARAAASDARLPIIKQRERDKRIKYTALAKEYDAKFMPFVCDGYGALGDDAIDFVEWLATEAVGNAKFEKRREFKSLAWAWIAVSIQRATAICARTGAQLIRTLS